MRTVVRTLTVVALLALVVLAATGREVKRAPTCEERGGRIAQEEQPAFNSGMWRAMPRYRSEDASR